MKARHARWRAYAVGMLLSWSYLAGWDLAPRTQSRGFAMHLVAVAAVITVVLRNRPELRVASRIAPSVPPDHAGAPVFQAPRS